MVVADIARSSLDELRERYVNMRGADRKFSLNIIEGDLRDNSENILKKIPETIYFDLVSC